MERKYLFFDTETSGLPRDWNASVVDLDNWPRLVQIGWVITDNEGNVTEKEAHLIRPERGVIFSQESMSVHGITPERALAEGELLGKVLSIFASKLKEVDLIVGHNVSFDTKVVGAEFLRAGEKNPFMDKNIFCTMESSTDFCKLPGSGGRRYKFPKLFELHQKLFDKGFEDAHDALSDTEACMRCFFALLDKKVIDLGRFQFASKGEELELPLVLDFSQALTILKSGGKVSRSGWNGKGMWVEMETPQKGDKMTKPFLFLSIPAGEKLVLGSGMERAYERVPWVISQSDVIKDDWFEIK